VSVTSDSSVVIDVWNVSEAVTSRTSSAPADRLTSSVCDVIVTSNDRLAFVSAAGSDEVGIFEMSSGELVDLMTHEGAVATFSITSDGAFMLVGLRDARPGQFNKASSSAITVSTCLHLCLCAYIVLHNSYCCCCY